MEFVDQRLQVKQAISNQMEVPTTTSSDDDDVYLYNNRFQRSHIVAEGEMKSIVDMHMVYSR